MDVRLGAFAEALDGTPRKLMDSSRLGKLGWKASIGLKDGLADAYRDYLGREAC